jgi:hypothetical protein
MRRASESKKSMERTFSTNSETRTMSAPLPLSPPGFDRGRRTFLKAGVAGSALLLLNRWLPPARAAEPAGTARVFTNLTDADAAALARIVPVMLAGALPQDHGERNAAIGEIILGVDLTIGYQPPHVRSEIRDLFGLLTRAVTRALIAGIWTSWEKTSDQDIQAFLASWRNSRLAMLRSAYIGLNNLIVGSWYADPKSWPRIGYPGPPKIA